MPEPTSVPDQGLVQFACCPVHGLHGQRNECFVCGGEVEQVEMVPREHLDAFVNAPYEEAEQLRREVDRLRLLVQDGYSALRRNADAAERDRREPDKVLCAVISMRSVATRMESDRDGADA